MCRIVEGTYRPATASARVPCSRARRPPPSCFLSSTASNLSSRTAACRCDLRKPRSLLTEAETPARHFGMVSGYLTPSRPETLVCARVSAGSNLAMPVGACPSHNLCSNPRIVCTCPPEVKTAPGGPSCTEPIQVNDAADSAASRAVGSTQTSSS